MRLYTNSHNTHITVTQMLTAMYALMCCMTTVLNKGIITDIAAKWELTSKCALCYRVTH
jgi:hypothetical protein